MLSLSNLLCDHAAGNERLRYGHRGPGLGTESISPARAPRPVVAWAITRACNLRCVHCYASATPGPAPGELSTAQCHRVLDDLQRFGVPAVLISGGEPLRRPDVFDLLFYARYLGLPVTLSTNGVLIDDLVADRIALAGVRYVGVSLDGLEAQHDRLRGQPGAFAATTAAIGRLRARGVKVGVRFTLHALNVHHLDDVFDLSLEMGVDRLCVYHLAYAGRGEGMRRVDLSPVQTRAAVDRLMERTVGAHHAGKRLEVLTVSNHADAAYVVLRLERSDPARAASVRRRLEGTGGNRSGCHIASIDAVGDVHYDQFSWHYTCGNVKDMPFSRIWADPVDPRLRVLRDRVSHLPSRCRGCRFLNLCNGNLRTRAEAATGDWLGLDPACYLTDAEIAASGPALSPAGAA